MGKQNMITVGDVRARGWTDALIRQFLGEPDTTARNPRYRTAAPMRLYALSRVEQAEATAAWRSARELAERRRQAANGAVRTKVSKLETTINELPMTITVLAEGDLRRKAYDHWSERRSARRTARAERRGKEAWEAWDDEGWEEEPTLTQAEIVAFRDRIAVNYIRHCLTVYDSGIASTYGRVGKETAIGLLRSRVYREIALAYPYLAAECDRQERERQEAQRWG